MDRSHLNQKTWKIANCLQVCSRKVFKMSIICTDTCLDWSSALSIMSSQKSEHNPTLLNCKVLSLLRTVNEQKEKCWYLHIVNLCAYFMTFNRYLLDRWQKVTSCAIYEKGKYNGVDEVRYIMPKSTCDGDVTVDSLTSSTIDLSRLPPTKACLREHTARANSVSYTHLTLPTILRV